MEIKLKTEPKSNRVVGIDLYLLNQYIIYIYVSVKDTLTYVTCSRCSTQRLWADVCHDAAGDPAGEDSEEPGTGDRAQGEHATLPDMQTTRLTNMLNSYFKCSFKDERISALEEKRRPLNESGNRPECYICHISLDKRVLTVATFPVFWFRKHTWAELQRRSWEKVPETAESSDWNGGRLIKLNIHVFVLWLHRCQLCWSPLCPAELSEWLRFDLGGRRCQRWLSRKWSGTERRERSSAAR